MSKRSVFAVVLAMCILSGCSSKAEKNQASVTKETTSVEVIDEDTVTPTPLPTRSPTPTPHVAATPTPLPDRDGTWRFCNPFTEDCTPDLFCIEGNIDVDRLQEFDDLFYTDWYFSWPDYDIEDDLLIGYSYMNFYEAPGAGMNFRAAWLYTSYRDPRDCNPYIACYYLQDEGYDIQAAVDEFRDLADDFDDEEELGTYGGEAMVTPLDKIDAQLEEFIGCSNSDLENPFGVSEYNGISYVVNGPTRQGGYNPAQFVNGIEQDDGSIILIQAGYPETMCIMYPNEDGTYRITENHLLRSIYIEGSESFEISSDELQERIQLNIDNNRISVSPWDDIEYHYDEVMRFSVYASRNAYLAAYGVIFDDPLLQIYFETMPWYEGVIPESEFDYSVMSEIELNNISEADSLLEELN